MRALCLALVLASLPAFGDQDSDQSRVKDCWADSKELHREAYMMGTQTLNYTREGSRLVRQMIVKDRRCRELQAEYAKKYGKEKAEKSK